MQKLEPKFIIIFNIYYDNIDKLLGRRKMAATK